jgi:hypothetical protein
MKKLLLILITISSIGLFSCQKGSCSDGEKNQDEAGIDCGGECSPCGTCNDNTKNQDEISIDCGGSVCDPCPTCTDGVQNQDEEDIDCGGELCNECETCFDGIMNGSETDTDCGGDCVECGKQALPVPCMIDDNTTKMGASNGVTYYYTYTSVVAAVTSALLVEATGDESSVEIYFSTKPVVNKEYKLSTKTDTSQVAADEVRIKLNTATSSNVNRHNFYGIEGATVYVHATTTGVKIEWCYVNFSTSESPLSGRFNGYGDIDVTY